MNNPKLITSVNQLSFELEKRVRSAQELIDTYKRILGDDHTDEVATVEEWVEECRAALKSPAPVSVALLGGTGAGKSTLVNSLLGASVLPTNAISVCTSAITRVRYKSGDEYSAAIELVPIETWMKQVQLASDDVISAQQGDDSDASYVTTNVISDDESSRIRAIYGDEAFEKFLEDGDISHLVLPSEIEDAFNQQVIHLTFSDTSELKKGISRYLTSKESFWPIVRSATIEGPFEAFDHGGELVDLPGLNDPNEAREEMTKTFLESAKFVWVVFNMKRSLGKELTQVLQSRDLLNRLMAGGRISTMTFVGTHSDDISTINPEDIELDEDASNSEIALRRNQLAETELRTNLRNVAKSIATSGEDTAETNAIIESLVKSPAFMISASNYMQITGAAKSRVAVIFDDEQQTNVPRLGNHLKNLCIEAGPKADAYTLVASLEEVVAELATLAREAQTEVALRNSEGASTKASLAKTATQSEKDLKSDTNKVLQALRGSLQQAINRFDKGTALDEEAVIRAVQKATDGWSSTHWATLRATASRGGRHTSGKGVEYDLIKELSLPVITHSMKPWTDFFGKDLPALTNEANNGLRMALANYSSSLMEFGSDDAEVQGVLTQLMADLMADVIESVDTALEVVKKTIESDLNERKQKLHRITEEAITSSMSSVFSKAAAERGTGMKVRMTSTLQSGSKNAVRTACGRVQKELGQTAQLAMEAILELVEPAAGKIEDKSTRITATLSDLTSGKKVTTEAEIEKLLKAVDVSRQVVSRPMQFNDGALGAETDAQEPEVITPEVGDDGAKQLVLVDASNVARSPGAPPDIQKLENCRSELILKFPDASIVLVADASLPRLVEQQCDEDEIALFRLMQSDNRLTVVPPGTPGKADSFILNLARRQEGIVVSNDSYREFLDDNQWLFSTGRLYGHTYVPTVGWQFSERYPVLRGKLPPVQ
jgi:hypothetical protein